ncbi:CASP8 and FADD-like apoptosis regulator [Aplochiton taeniatus]
MANGHLIQIINRIAEKLNSSECKQLFYLCGCLDTDSCLADVTEMLNSYLTQGQVDHTLLVELVFGLKRFDILKTVFGKSKDEVERILESKHVLSKYRILMVNISDDMMDENLRSLKFLLSGTLHRAKMDKAQDFLDIVVELEKLGKCSSGMVDFIEQCLRNIGRVDLAITVNQYRMSAPENYASVISEQRRHSAQNQLDEYSLHADPRGLCVIIDCVGLDGDMLKQTFTRLRFNVILHTWLRVDETLSVLRHVTRQREHHDAGAFVCCIISRGTSTDLLATDAHRLGLGLDTVRRLFTAEACPMLAGKPKLFFIQRYSVPEAQSYDTGTVYRDEDLETDAGGGEDECVPTDADVFWSHCWTEESQLEQSNHHSVYLQALTNSLEKAQKRKTHLVDVHTDVNRVIYDQNKKNPGATYSFDLKHTLRKNLFLV